MLQEEFDIANLIARFIARNITDKELIDLKLWKEASQENNSLFEKLIRPEHYDRFQWMASQYDAQEAWNTFQKRLLVQKKWKYYSIFTRWYYYAAILLLPLLVVYFIRQQSVQDNCLMSIENKETVTTITPGSSKAILTMADGLQVDLDQSEAFELEEKGAKINKDSSVLKYESATSIQEEVYNQLYVPKGGEYSLVLNEGTKVYLNAMTTLRFPVHFTGNERRVELQGEAYFEVSPSDKPFIVQTKETTVEVLGTTFNISSYTQDEFTRTTLVSGRVKVSLNGSNESVFIAPSQQAAFNHKTGRLSVLEVDISSDIAWKNGLFYFKDWRLEDIMTCLSRWYDFDITYSDKEIMNYRFGCKFDRYGKITPILELLEKTNKISAKVNGKTIVLKGRN